MKNTHFRNKARLKIWSNEVINKMSKTIPVSSDLSFWLHYEDCPMILSEFKVVHKTLNIKMLDQQGARKQKNY